MSIAIRAQPLQFPRSLSAPSTFQALIEAIAQYTIYNFDPDYVLLVKGPNTPQAQDQNKLWLKTDGVGRPLGLYTLYNGAWRQVATGNPTQITMFGGAWADYFDATGLGYAGLPWDGWAIANGQNGTINLTNKFLVPGYRCDGYGYWITNVEGFDAYSGGRSMFQIALNNLPLLEVNLSAQTGYASGGSNFGAVSTDQSTQIQWNYPVAGTGANDQISLIPPFIAIGFCQFIGYVT